MWFKREKRAFTCAWTHTPGGSFLNQTHLASQIKTKKLRCLVLHESRKRTSLHNLISLDFFPVISAQCLFIASCFIINNLIIIAVECFGFNLEVFHIALESSSLWLIKAVVSFLQKLQLHSSGNIHSCLSEQS